MASRLLAAILAQHARVLETENPAAGRVLQDLVILLQAQTHLPGHFDVTGIAPLLVFNAAHGLGHLAGLAVHRARRPVGAADLVQHRAADADTGIGLETRTLLGIEFPRRLDQPDHAGLDEIIGLHAGRQPAHQVVGNALDQWFVQHDQFVTVAFTCR